METVTKLKDLTVEEFKTLISDTIRESMEDILEDLTSFHISVLDNDSASISI